MRAIAIENGQNPATGKAAVANGFFAIGQRSSGVFALGQFCTGYVAVGQFALGRVFALGQFAAAPVAVGQFGIGGAILAQSGAAVFGIFQSGLVLSGGIGQNILNIGEAVRGFFA